ncbi:hypothetical protein [Variovorax sp. RA8]|uniref:hypothetical protein n=1 Tax=Variovorax sp. (strain JCM 16519 / RA8) TaxID=662548 RepID=UPI000AA7348C|nr:hypothetical protein [Variovorax sp. RA8]VTU30523.1 hypothetical protein RA8CHR_04174 [Variovorax sp. RA8]
MAQGTARIGRDHYCTQIDLASGQTLVSDEPSVLGGEGGVDDVQKARLVDIAERTPVTLTLKAGISIRTHLL